MVVKEAVRVQTLWHRRLGGFLNLQSDWRFCQPVRTFADVRTPVSRPRVAVLDDYQNAARQMAPWSDLNARVEFFHDHLSDPDDLRELLAPFDVVVAMRERTVFNRNLLEQLPNLRLLVSTGRRNASIDLQAATDLGVSVAGTPTPPFETAEHAWALILAVARGIVPEANAVADGKWQVSLGREMAGATLGIVGLGRLGGRVARYGLAFEMRVIAWSHNLTSERAAEIGVTAVSKEELLQTSDFVTIHQRLSDRTRGMFGEQELALMKPTSYLINTSRGPIVDEQALLKAVRNKSIAGAALDVFDVEPLPLDHPFRSEPGILVTPHIGYVTRETYQVFYGAAVEAIAAWQGNRPFQLLASSAR